MIFSPLTLAVSALFFVSLFPAGTSVVSAQPGNKNVSRLQGAVFIKTLRSRPADAPRVIVTPDRNPVRVGELVTFTLTPAQMVLDRRYVVTVHFGDGTRRQATGPYVTHRYGATGHYKVHASVAGGDGEKGTADPNQLPTQVPRVTLDASPSSVIAGQPVTLTAQLSSGYPNIRYRFEFGDGMQSNWQASSLVTHEYAAPGNYLAFVDIGVVSGAGVRRLGGSPRKSIQVTNAPLGPVELIVSPATAETGRPVSLTARLVSSNPNIRYRFVFGDGSPPGAWQSSAQTMHTYRSAGTYSPYVDVGLLTNRGFRPEASSRRSIVVTAPVANDRRPKTDSPGGSTQVNAPPVVKPTPGPAASPSPSIVASGSPSPPASVPAGIASPDSSISPVASTGERNTFFTGDPRDDWWKYLLLALLLAFVAYRLGKWWLGPGSTVHTFADPGTATVTDAKGLAIDSQVILRPNLTEAQHDVSPGEAGLVKNVRRENV
jgi:PKD repeat protein